MAAFPPKKLVLDFRSARRANDSIAPPGLEKNPPDDDEDDDIVKYAAVVVVVATGFVVAVPDDDPREMDRDMLRLLEKVSWSLSGRRRVSVKEGVAQDQASGVGTRQ